LWRFWIVRYEKKICLNNFRQNRTWGPQNVTIVRVFLYVYRLTLLLSGSSGQLTWHQYTNREWGRVQGTVCSGYCIPVRHRVCSIAKPDGLTTRVRQQRLHVHARACGRSPVAGLTFSTN
jgi:hypothetical protein